MSEIKEIWGMGRVLWLARDCYEIFKFLFGRP